MLAEVESLSEVTMEIDFLIGAELQPPSSIVKPCFRASHAAAQIPSLNWSFIHFMPPALPL